MAEDFTTLFRVNQPHFPHQLSRPIGPEPFQCMAEITGFEPVMAESNSAVITSSLYLNINQSNYLFATLSILFTLCLDTQ